MLTSSDVSMQWLHLVVMAASSQPSFNEMMRSIQDEALQRKYAKEPNSFDMPRTLLHSHQEDDELLSYVAHLTSNYAKSDSDLLLPKEIWDK